MIWHRYGPLLFGSRGMVLQLSSYRPVVVRESRASGVILCAELCQKDGLLAACVAGKASKSRQKSFSSTRQRAPGLISAVVFTPN